MRTTPSSNDAEPLDLFPWQSPVQRPSRAFSEVIRNIQLCRYVKYLRCLHARGNLVERGNGLSPRLVFHVPLPVQRSLCPATGLPLLQVAMRQHQ